MSKPANERYTIAVDFDGVIHRYDSPWVNAHTIPDPPVDGAIWWLYHIIQKFDVVIFSTRCKTLRGRRAVRRWLKGYSGELYSNVLPGFRGIEEVRLSHKKPAALIYLDDRAVRFEGTFPTASDVHALRPWNKPRASSVVLGPSADNASSKSKPASVSSPAGSSTEEEDKDSGA